jgi:hypothetical protein
MTMTDNTTTADIALAGLYAAGYRTEYVPDPAWDGWLYADLRDEHGRRWQCGSGATEAEALADLLRRLDRDGWPDAGAAAETPEQLREALQELNEENLELQDELAESRRSVALCVRVLADLCAEAYPDGISAASDLKGQLRKLLDAGHRVEFSKNPEGYVATAGGHDATAYSPAAAVAAVAAAACSGED